MILAIHPELQLVLFIITRPINLAFLPRACLARKGTSIVMTYSKIHFKLLPVVHVQEDLCSSNTLIFGVQQYRVGKRKKIVNHIQLTTLLNASRLSRAGRALPA